MIKKLLFIFIFSILIIPNIILASTFSVNMSCPNAASAGEKITCKITANVDADINEIKGNFSNEGLGSLTFDKNNKLNFTQADSNGFRISEEGSILSKTGSNSFEIGTVNATIPGNATEGNSFKITINSITANGNLTYATITSNIHIKSSDNTLKSLSVGNYPLSPVFNSSTTSYKVQAEDVPKVNITAVANNSGATISGAGDVNLKYGDNTINVVVKSETGATKTYKIVINRFDSRDKTNTLNNLVVAGYDLDKAFSPETTKYKVTVESNVTSVKINAELTPSEEKQKIMSTFVKKYGPRTQKLNYGDNNVQIRVRAENEKVRTYTLIIHRIDDRDPNNYLKSLEISSGKYKFDKEIGQYIINVENNVSVVSIKAIAESEKAKVDSVSKLELKEGSNKITIKVTAENEKERKYVITINRLKEGTTIEEVENIVYLKQLKVLNKNISFNQKTTTYEIPITDESEVTFTYELYEGTTGTIELKDDETGPIKLSSEKSDITISPVIDGSIIYLNLMSPEGYTRQFTFNVKTADYYIGDIEIPIEKDPLVIKWTWQLIVALVSILIILVELGFAIYFAIKNGGVENKRRQTEESIKSGIDDIKKIPEKNEQRKLQRAEAAKLKKAEKERLAEEKKKAKEEWKKQRELDKIQREQNKILEKQAKEMEKKIDEEKKRIAAEAAKSQKEYEKSIEKPQ